MTSVVYHGCKALNQTNKNNNISSKIGTKCNLKSNLIRLRFVAFAAISFSTMILLEIFKAECYNTQTNILYTL